MLLHIVNKSPFERDALVSCLQHAQPEAGILLIEDGVYAATLETQYTPVISQALARVSIYALASDVTARGINDRLIPGVQLVDYDGFVELVVRHSATQSWL